MKIQYSTSRAHALASLAIRTNPLMAVTVIDLIERLAANTCPECPVESARWVQKASIMMKAAGPVVTRLALETMQNHFVFLNMTRF